MKTIRCYSHQVRIHFGKLLNVQRLWKIVMYWHAPILYFQHTIQRFQMKIFQQFYITKHHIVKSLCAKLMSWCASSWVHCFERINFMLEQVHSPQNLFVSLLGIMDIILPVTVQCCVRLGINIRQSEKVQSETPEKCYSLRNPPSGKNEASI